MTYVQVAQIIESYLQIVEKIGFAGTNPQDNEYVQEAVDRLKYYKWKDPASIEDAFALCARIRECMRDLQRILDIFERTAPTPEQTGSTVSGVVISTKYIEDTHKSLNNIRDAIEPLLRELPEGKILSIINNNLIDSGIDQIIMNYRMHDSSLVIDFFMVCVQYLYDTLVGKPGSKERIREINRAVDDLKLEALTSHKWNILSEKMSANMHNVVQRMIHTHGLVQHEYMPLTDLLKSIGINDSNPKLDAANCAKYSKLLTASGGDKKFGLVVLRKLSPRPLIHHTERIINVQYAADHEYITPIDAGVSEKLVSRTTLLSVLLKKEDADDNVLLIDSSQHTGGDGGDNDYYYVLQTLDNVSWTLMHPWDYYSEIKYVRASIFGVDSISLSTDPRLSMYATCVNDAILQHVKMPYIENALSMIEVKLEDSAWAGMRARVRDKILESYKNALGGISAWNMENVKNVVLDADLARVHINILAQHAMDSMAKHMSDIVRRELAVSFVSEKIGIEKKWSIKLTDLLVDAAWAESRIEGSNALARVNAVVGLLRELLDELLKIFINRKSGIFISIQNVLDVLEKVHIN